MELPCGPREIKWFCQCWHVCVACILLHLSITSMLICVSFYTVLSYYASCTPICINNWSMSLPCNMWWKLSQIAIVSASCVHACSKRQGHGHRWTNPRVPRPQKVMQYLTLWMLNNFFVTCRGCNTRYPSRDKIVLKMRGDFYRQIPSNSTWPLNVDFSTRPLVSSFVDFSTNIVKLLKITYKLHTFWVNQVM